MANENNNVCKYGSDNKFSVWIDISNDIWVGQHGKRFVCSIFVITEIKGNIIIGSLK